jgi:peptide subunit release factor 1 (eRF1)
MGNPPEAGTPLAAFEAMAKSTLATATPLRQQMERLASFEPSPFPVLSLYLDLSADQHGRDSFEPFIRKTFAERLKGFAARSSERESFERDVQRITAYLGENVNRSSNALALFACAGADDFFEAIQLEAGVDEHWLFIGSVPHLYPLARLVDQYPRYAAVVLDKNKARIFVFGLAALTQTAEVTSDKTKRTSVGGWSQARYQRRDDNFHLLHVKEVVDVLDRLVRTEQIPHIIVAGDEVAVPLLRDQLPPHLAEKLVDVIRLEKSAGEREILEATLEALREKDASTDAEHVERLMDAWRSGGLGVAGPEATLKALEMGQVDELLITGSLEQLKGVQRLPAGSAQGAVHADTSAPQGAADDAKLKVAGELVMRAEQTGASIRFVENADLLAGMGGVGALLRFRISDGRRERQS